jgi:micrococcal nuclease
MEMITYKDTIPFIPPISEGTVVKVYDGDTITIATKLPYDNSPYYRFSVRLKGIDCPEIKTSNLYEKQCALIARDFLRELIMDKIVILKDVELEKYGRILANVYIDDQNVSGLLCEKKLAVTYEGGTKQSPKNWMNYYNGLSLE